MSQRQQAAVAHEKNTGKVLAWSLWDWGSAAFNAVVVTFVFSVYLVDAVGSDLPGRISASSWLGWSLGAAGVFIAVLAPAFGQRSDAHGRRKRSLFIMTFAVVVIMAGLFFVKDDYHYLWLGLLLIAGGSVIFELCQVPYFAMLRQVSTPRNVGKISGIGWAFGYLGGIVLLLICLFGFISGDGPTRGLLGVPTADGMNIRLIALVAAGWFALFALPLFFMVPELPPSEDPDEAKVGFVDSYRVLFADVRRMWAEDRVTLKFLIASAFYRDGLAGVFAFGAILAVTVYGLTQEEVMYFAVAANVLAAAGALAGGWLDDKVGPRAVIVASLVSMLVVSIGLFWAEGKTLFWVLGLLLCLFVGPAQSASRTYLTRITDVGREGQNFGLYAMTGRVVSFMTPMLFGLFVFLGNDDRYGILGIAVVLAGGLILLLAVPARVDDRAESVI